MEAGKYGERIPVMFANSAGFFLFRSSLDGNWNEGKDFMTTWSSNWKNIDIGFIGNPFEIGLYRKSLLHTLGMSEKHILNTRVSFVC